MEDLSEYIAVTLVFLARLAIYEMCIFAVCWAFGVGFDAKYAVGIMAIEIMVKTIF